MMQICGQDWHYDSDTARSAGNMGQPVKRPQTCADAVHRQVVAARQKAASRSPHAFYRKLVDVEEFKKEATNPVKLD